jgi:hypothetical protein
MRFDKIIRDHQGNRREGGDRLGGQVSILLVRAISRMRLVSILIFSRSCRKGLNCTYGLYF